jgi:hypothetical protein
MYDNNVYNLMMQAVQEHKSLWRILNDYREDAEGDEELLAFWDQLATQKGEQVALLEQLIADRESNPEDEVAPDAAPVA